MIIIALFMLGFILFLVLLTNWKPGRGRGSSGGPVYPNDPYMPLGTNDAGIAPDDGQQHHHHHHHQPSDTGHHQSVDYGHHGGDTGGHSGGFDGGGHSGGDCGGHSSH